jgi:hypothetical protein
VWQQGIVQEDKRDIARRYYQENKLDAAELNLKVRCMFNFKHLFGRTSV